MIIYIDGKYLPADQAKISVFDHGFLYGDGVFEGIRAYNGRVFRLKEHLDRLYDSAKTIDLHPPLSKDELAEVICELLRKNKLENAYIRPVISRGVGDLGLDPRKCPRPSVIIIAVEWGAMYGDLYEKGLTGVTVSIRRTPAEALPPNVKSLNYLNNILAKIEANNGGCEEAVMLNAEGFVAECTGDNVFIVKNDALFTPPLSAGALYGITRQTVIELAEDSGFKVSEPNLTRYDLFNADECFLTGTGAEIVPVVKIDGRVIGTGIPGRITRRLEDEYHALTKVSGEPIYK
jgi:branched-chain amino acid aminotransferase